MLTYCVSLLVFLPTLHFFRLRSAAMKRCNVMLIGSACWDKRPTLVRGWSVKFSASTRDGNIIGKILFSLVGKGKTIPLQAWTGPEGSRRLRLPDLKSVGT